MKYSKDWSRKFPKALHYLKTSLLDTLQIANGLRGGHVTNKQRGTGANEVAAIKLPSNAALIPMKI